MISDTQAIWLRWTRLATVLAFLLAICLPNLNQVGLAWSELAERECPAQEHEGVNAQQVIVLSSARRRSMVQQQRDDCRSCEHGLRVSAVAFSDGCLPTVVGHQLPNGLRAPLLI